MKKFVCTVCGYVHEGDSAPENVQYVALAQINLKIKHVKENGLQSTL